MKKVFLAMLVVVISFGMVYAQSITGTSPHGGDSWIKGSAHTITWTKNGSMNANVKIRLMQGSTKILAITDSTANNGSFSWTIPSSVANGSY